MIGASDEQLDVFNEVWFISLLNIGQVPKGTVPCKGCFIKSVGSKTCRLQLLKS